MRTRTSFFSVPVGAVVPTGAAHISALHNGGHIAHRIDAVFLTPPPALPAVVAAVPADVVAPAVSAPLPASLPNTAGELPTAPSPVPVGLITLLTLGATWRLTRINRA